MRNLILFYLIMVLIALALPSTGLCEYIRATNEEEIILVPTESEVKIGKSLSEKVEKKFGLVEDIFLQKRIDEIGQKITAVCDRKDILYHFKVLMGKELKPEERLNAFAVPGGYIYLFKDMVELMGSDDEIAAILAHEVGHIAAKHSVKRFQGSMGAMLFQFLTAGISADGDTRGRVHNAIGLLMMSYSREDEVLADKLSVRYVKEAGYNPEAILSSMDKMMDKYRKMPIRKFSAYQTHPYVSERKAAVKKEIYGRMEFVDFINTPATLGER